MGICTSSSNIKLRAYGSHDSLHRTMQLPRMRVQTVNALRFAKEMDIQVNRDLLPSQRIAQDKSIPRSPVYLGSALLYISKEHRSLPICWAPCFVEAHHYTVSCLTVPQLITSLEGELQRNAKGLHSIAHTHAAEHGLEGGHAATQWGPLLQMKVCCDAFRNEAGSCSVV